MLRAEGVVVEYPGTDGRVRVLDGVDLDVDPGLRLGLAGPSGCGKSTLLRVLARLQAADRGRVLLDGRHVDGVGTTVPAAVRRRVQLLWQAPRSAVDPRLPIDRVIGQPLRYAGASRQDVRPTVERWAERVGLTEDLLRRSVHEVSDGQLQRACLARALVVEPDVLLADELGSMLDVSTQASLLSVLAEEVARRHLAVVLVSHDRLLLDHWCDEVLEMRDGRLVMPRRREVRPA